eukprot:gene17256-18981_t
MSLCRDQGYDGAGNMASKCAGASSRISRQYPKAPCVHFGAHALNLCVASACTIQAVRNIMSQVRVVSDFFNNSPTKNAFLIAKIKSIVPKARHIHLINVCRTRWVARIDGLDIFAEVTRPLTKQIQAVSFDAVAANEKVSLLYATLRRLQNEKSIHHGIWFDEGKELANSVNVEPSRPGTMEVVQELGLLISLADGLVSVHDLKSFKSQHHVYRAKGASFFAVSLKMRQEHTDASPILQLRLCIVVKKKLVLLYWVNGKFEELYPELGMAESPKTVGWCGDYICIGGKRDYFLVKADTGNFMDLFPVGKQLEPLIKRLKTDELALSRDEMTVLMTVNEKGKTHQKHGVTWSDVPIDIEFHAPYILAILPKFVEIWCRDPRVLIQKIELESSKLKSLVQHRFCYIASQNCVWRLVPVGMGEQIKQLTDEKQFEVALTLVNIMDEEQADKERRISEIKLLFACDLFCRKKKFEEALQIFTEINTASTYVIGLYPNLLPEGFRKQLEYPYPLPDLSDGDLERAMHHLITYLAKIRSRRIDSTDTVDGSAVQLQQIIDTSLLKCYLQTNEALIASLLRLKDNHCHFEESERVLRKGKKYNELILLYQNKGHHTKALDLLLRQADKTSGPLKGHSMTVKYLQNLGAEHLKLIFSYSSWVLKRFPEDGLKIFTENIHEIDPQETEGLSREAVIQHLEKHAPSLVFRYLEHIINDWKENRAEFHNRLALCYKEKILPLFKEYAMSLPEGHQKCKAGKEPGELGELRNKLLFLLETSTQYQPLKLLRHFPNDNLFEERALLLGRAGRHEDALAIYIYILKDTMMAENYCRRQYEYEREENKDVYLSLLKMYLKPKDTPLIPLGNYTFSEYEMEPNVEAALKVMNEHYQKIDVEQVLDLLPPLTQIKDVCSFLNNILESKMIERRHSQIFRSLLYAEHLQVHEQRIFYQSQKCTIIDERACRVCHKRIGTR